MIQSRPPTILTHPFELAFAALFLIIGAGLLVRGHEIRVSTVQSLPMPLVVGWEVCLLLGGPLMALGLWWRGSQTMGRALERSGLYMAGAAWASYAVTLAWLLHSHLVVVPIAQAVAIATACLLRAWALRRVDRAVTSEGAGS